jgi:hypothetical protein
MKALSAEQSAVVRAGLRPISVVACAGSGKTHTAIRRLAEMRSLLGNSRGRVALLSFSNVAVETFRSGYADIAAAAASRQDRVEIDTLDGFITRYILLPHAYRTMGSKRAAYLVTGREGLLASFNFHNGKFPVSIMELRLGFRNGGPYFYSSFHDTVTEVPLQVALKLVNGLGSTGAYTHELGRYWCHKTLATQPAILCAFANRYPHIVVDEAQDIGTAHQAILGQLVAAGVQVSLIGDPNQGIYEFAGADGSYLRTYAADGKAQSFALTRNFRSVPRIVDVANGISARSDVAVRETPTTYHGAYFAVYAKGEEAKLVEAFQLAVKRAELDLAKSAVICRATKLANTLSGADAAVGQGIPKALTKAAVLRDKHGNYVEAFEVVAGCAVALLAKPPNRLVAYITQPHRYPEWGASRQLIWQFTRDAETGLPHATKAASTEWHPVMVARIKELVSKLANAIGTTPADSLGQKLSKKDLPDAPLMAAADLASVDVQRMRVDTVHQVKGESLDAVLYIATKEHAERLVEGVGTEVGRIGYVAVTRARNLVWLGIAAASVNELRPKLLASKFVEVGTTDGDGGRGRHRRYPDIRRAALRAARGLSRGTTPRCCRDCGRRAAGGQVF